MASSSSRFLDAARKLGIEPEVREFPQGTRTAEDAARAIGVELGQIVKSLVFLADGRPVLCLVSGPNRLDTRKLAQIAGATKIDRADADSVRAATGYVVGGVPPFGHEGDIPVYCDGDLLQYEMVWAAAGTPMSVFAIEPQRLADVCEATIGDLKED
jgi:Cys-tRNA(Pro) deacylase